MKITVTKGLLFYDDNTVVPLHLSDRIAQENGFLFAERLIEAHKDKKLILDENFKIKEIENASNL